MIVVVDTNIFHGDPRMRRANFRILLGQHAKGSVRLVLPEVVVREVPKLFATQLDAAVTAIKSAATKLRDLGHDPGAINVPNVGKARVAYDKWLRNFLKERNIEVSPLTGDVDELLDQAVAERRPFRAKSMGFRDALIWRSVLQLAEEDEVILVTKNWKDFAQDEKRPDVLHEHLREDLKAAGLAGDRLRLVASLEDFIKAEVPTADQVLTSAQLLLEENDDWREQLFEAVHEALYGLDLEWSDRVTVVETASAEIDDVAVHDVKVEAIEIVDAFETDEKDLFSLEISVRVTLWFTFTTDIVGAEWLADEHADVDLDRAAETLFQGMTMGRAVVVTYRADFTPETREVGELEKISADDAPDDGDGAR